jgi:hypothetical protein
MVVTVVTDRIIKIMAATKRRVSFRELFKKFNILPLASEFLLSLLSFIVVIVGGVMVIVLDIGPKACGFKPGQG